MMEGVQQRFYNATLNYCNGVLEQVGQEHQARVPGFEEQLVTRRGSAGVTPLFALIEYDELHSRIQYLIMY